MQVFEKFILNGEQIWGGDSDDLLSKKEHSLINFFTNSSYENHQKVFLIKNQGSEGGQ